MDQQLSTTPIDADQAAKLHFDQVAAGRLPQWIVTRAPRDLPQYPFVARLACSGPGVPAGLIAWGDFVAGDTLDQVRAQIPKWCVRLDRYPNDEPHIVESWI